MKTSKRPFIALTILLCLIVVIAFLLVRYWYQPTYEYVYTDDARVDGVIVSIVAENMGQVVQIPYDVNDEISEQQPVAKLKVPVITAIPSSDNPKYVYQNILSPISGTIANRMVDVGDTVSPGQALFTVIDPNNMWVVANIDENKIKRVEQGQCVDIHVDATDEILSGKVEYIIPLTTTIVQRQAAGSVVVAANTQDVPVKILLNKNAYPSIYPGLSVEVTIYTK